MTNENENVITVQEAKRRFRLAYPLYQDKREPVPEGVIKRQHGNEVETVPLKWESGKRRLRRTQRVSLGPRAVSFKTWVRTEYEGSKQTLAPKLATIVGGKAQMPASYVARKATQDANRKERYRSNAAGRGMKKAKAATAPPALSKKELAAAAEATAKARR